MDTIILYGMRGTGKSTIGKQVSKKLGYIFIDLDKYIEEEVEMKLDKYIELNGWDNFRDIEHECLKKVLLEEGKKIISLGGGTIIFKRNIKEIRKYNNKKLIFLKTDIDIIAKRIENDEKNNIKRNSLTGGDVINELENIYKDRKKIYKKHADKIIKNNGNLNESINKVINIINKSKICISIIDFDKKNLMKIYKKLNSIDEVGYIELRIDFLDNLERLRKLIKKCSKQIIVTNRLKQEGGKFIGSYAKSIEIQKKALDYGAYLIDIELIILEKIHKPELDFRKVIISSHNFEKTPKLEELIKILNKMKRYNPSVYKIAVTPTNEEDVDIIYKLAKYFKKYFIGKNFIFISMGELGKQSRIDLFKDGGLLTFASLGGKSSAPGQIDYKDLLKNKEIGSL